MVKVVINRRFGGFGLSDEAYEKLIEYGVPVRKYTPQDRDPETRLYKPQPLNDGEVIFDRELTPEGEDSLNDLYWKYKPNSIHDRYWETWIDDNRTHPLLIRVVEELGDKANGKHSELKIIEIPDDVKYEIDKYDGLETIHEVHRSWS